MRNCDYDRTSAGRATIGDLRTLLHGDFVEIPEDVSLPCSREDLAELVPHLTRAERVLMERLLPPTVEDEEGAFDLSRLTDPELCALRALQSKAAGIENERPGHAAFFQRLNAMMVTR